MGHGKARLYNLVSLVFLVLAILFAIWVISRALGPAV
jgi:hypothetical protein